MNRPEHPYPAVTVVVLAGFLLAAGSATAQDDPAASSVRGEEIPGPSFEQLLELRDVGGAVLSPDGGAVAYTVRGTEWEENGYDTEIWLVRTGSEPFQLTRTLEGSSTSPAWSPDGRWLAFTADRGEKSQIHLIDPRGGEAWALTESEEGVGGFEWSPDGSRIAFTRQEPESEADEEREEKFGSYAVEDEEYRPTHLWVVDLPATPGVSEAERLTEGPGFTVTSFEWSPDGSRIAFAHQPDPLINSWMKSDISVLDVETLGVTPVVTAPGYDGGPRWSPEGEWLLYASSGPDLGSVYYTNSKFFKIPAAGGEPIRVASDFDEDPGVLDWNARGIFLIGWQKTKRQVLRVDPETGRTEPFLTEPDQIWSVDFTADGETLVVVARSPSTLDEVYLSSGAAAPLERLTNMTAQIEGWALGTSEVISWESRDGTTIEGVLHKPDDFDPNRQYPLFVVIHGGPTGIDYPTAVTGYVYPVHQWLAKGALVLRPNYRGSAGYGEAFRALNVRNLGVGDAWDVLSGVDHLISLGIVDESRMGAMGWSQGGYISAYLTTTTDRFAAISVGAGISNWTTYYVNTDIHPFTRQYLEATPWEDPEIYAKTSPMTFIRDASTPTLIQHGEFDRRVPIPNAYELFQGLEDVGVETKLIVYKGFGHGINKPKERLAAMWHNWQWFAEHVWGEQVALPIGDASPAEAGGGEDG